MSSHLQLSVFRTSGATAALRTSVIITNYCWHIAYKECCNLVDRKRQEFAMEGSTQYRAIPKGRGFVYVYDSQLYRQAKKVGRVRYPPGADEQHTRELPFWPASENPS